MVKTILQCEIIIIDIIRDPLTEVEFILKVLQQHKPKNKVKVIGISNYMTWSNMRHNEFTEVPHDK